ncbi:Integrator complex subunit 4 [Actinomortierella wolfii]|nr:Integrator complex subunit 4 [Actinomortierella wolfii]
MEEPVTTHTLSLQALDTAGSGDEMQDLISDQEGSEDEDDEASDHEDFHTFEVGEVLVWLEVLRAMESSNVRARIRAFKLLLNRMAMLTPSERIRLLAVARRRLYTETDKAAKILLIQLLQNIVETANVDTRSVVEDLLSQLRADSTEVRVQLGLLPRNNISDLNTIRALISGATAELKDRHHRIRSAAIQLLARLAPMARRGKVGKAGKETSSQSHIKEPSEYTQHDIQIIISNYVTDPEPRVRKTALQALLELHRKRLKLALILYDVAITALADDYQEVRMEGLDLMLILSQLYPTQRVSSPQMNGGRPTKLVDDAFVRICDMVNDSTVAVRAKACTYLGKFRNVDYAFLKQTFSKQIMARGRVDEAPKNLAAGPAQKQAQRAKLIATPEGDQDVTGGTVRLLDSGACGAFVHGLEDEYRDVRDAAIHMFMDEIDYVRLNALTSLRKIGQRATLTFDTEQLQIALGVLEDADRDVREAAHGMLQVIQMASPDGMTSFLQSLKSNLKRFPEDQMSIYQCIRAVGRRHGAFIEPMVAEILNLNPMFLSVEEKVDDIYYGAYLILIFNAAVSTPGILRMLPKYTFKHYTYLRDKYPNCFPEPQEIPCPGTQPLRDLATALASSLTEENVSMDIETNVSPSASTTSSGVLPFLSSSSANPAAIAAMKARTDQDAEAFYERAQKTMVRIHALFKRYQRQSTSQQRQIIMQQIDVCLRDLRYLMSVHSSRARNAEFMGIYLQCCQLILKIQDSYNMPMFVIQAPILAAQLFRLSYSMDHVFLGLDATAKIAVRYFRVLANLAWFFGMVKEHTSEGSGSNVRNYGGSGVAERPGRPKSEQLTKEYIQSMLQRAIQRLSDLQRQMDQPEVDQTQIQHYRVVMGDLRVALVRAFNSPSTSEIVRLMDCLMNFVPLEINFGQQQLERIEAQVTRPQLNRDVPQDIHATFPFLIQVEGLVHHVHTTDGIAVQIGFPNGEIRHYYPPENHFTRIDEDDTLDPNTTAMEVTPDGAESAVDEDESMMDVDEVQDATASDAQTKNMMKQKQKKTPKIQSFRLRTSIEVYPDPAWGHAPTELRISLSRSFQPDLEGHDEFICRFAEEVAYQHQDLGSHVGPSGTTGPLSIGMTSNSVGGNAGLASSLTNAIPALTGHWSAPSSAPRSQGGESSSSFLGAMSISSASSSAAATSLTGLLPLRSTSSNVSMNAQSTLEISKPTSYYVKRRQTFSSS